MADHVRGAVVKEVDTNALFEKYTIDEIREIEKKTRQDIERKKEDLRIMVGERYRELIEAADTISEMKNSTQNVLQSVGRIQELCGDLRQTFQAKTFSSLSSKAKIKDSSKKEENHFYTLAVQIKLLMDMPEKIWSSLDGRHYLRATRLFLLSRHLHTGLQSIPQYGGKVHGWFPVLTRQWAAISHFRPTILQACRRVLCDVSVPDAMTAECLCSVLLLEDSTPRQVFNEFLTARSTSVSQLFRPDQGAVSIKSQICDVVRTLVTTIHQVCTIFCADAEAGIHHGGKKVASDQLMKILSEVTDKGEKGAILTPSDISISSKHTSKTVYSYRPQLQQHGTAIQLSALQDNCLTWIDTCKSTVREGLSTLLAFISTVKGLAAIRDEVWDQLRQDDKLNTWDEVCQQVAKRKLQIWDEFFRPYFMERAKALLQAHFDSAVSLCKLQVGRVLTDVANWEDRATESERNLSNYIWQEGPGDLPANMAWVPVSSRQATDASGLMMKAKAYTPAVQGLCRSFDSKVSVLLEDANHYLALPDEVTTDTGPFDRFADREDVHSFLEAACQQCVSSLTSHLNAQLSSSQAQLSGSSTDPRSCKVIIDRMLLLGRFCTALGELCLHLKQCMSLKLSVSDKQAAGSLDRSFKKIRSQSKINENPKWTEMKSQLNAFGQEAYKMWTGYMAQSLVSQFNKFLQENSHRALLRVCTKWDEVVIEEETEEGQKIKSTIRVPMQVSWYVQSLLYDLCEEINRIGGHALPRLSLAPLVIQLSDGVLDAYEAALDADNTRSGDNNTDTKDPGETSDPPADPAPRPPPKLPLTQNRALQLMFDLRALINIIPRRDDSEASSAYQARGQQLVERLEGLVDPFDLDVFMPYIQRHLSRHTYRSNVLYGALMSMDRHTSYTTASKPPSSTQQEQHNVLPLTSCNSRFPLLPLSIQTRRSLVQPIIQSPKPIAKHPKQTIKGSPLMSPSLGPASPPPMLSPTAHEEQSSSFFGQMSTIWFSNVGKKQ